jgi:uncharacterized protein
MEDDFIECMEYGMPPISGWGMGIDRFIALLTDQENLREVVLFPLMKPLYNTDSAPAEDKKEYVNDKKNKSEDIVSSAGAIFQPENIKNFGADIKQLDALFNEKIKSENLKFHSIASAAVLRGVAKRFSLNESNFYYLGLMHDIDFDEVKDMKIHGKTGADWLKKLGANEQIVNAVLSHNEEGTGIAKKGFVDYALACSESITGLISATAKVYPDKKVKSVQVKSVTKRMKEKAFAAKVNRDYIMFCEKIGLPLDEFTDIAIKSMIEVAEQKIYNFYNNKIYYLT